MICLACFLPIVSSPNVGFIKISEIQYYKIIERNRQACKLCVQCHIMDRRITYIEDRIKTKIQKKLKGMNNN